MKRREVIRSERGLTYEKEVLEYQKAAKLLMDCLGLTYSPMAVKLAKTEEEIPREAIRPLAGSACALRRMSVPRKITGRTERPMP